MTLFQVRGYWRRERPSGPTLRLDELVVAEDAARAEAQAIVSWRRVWPTLDGEPVVSSAKAIDEVGGFRVLVDAIIAR